MMITQILKDKNFWRRVRGDGRYDFITERIREYHRESYLPEPRHIGYADRFSFYVTGERDRLEKEYFRRRKQLSAAVVLQLLEPETDRSAEINELIFAVCDEYCWALPAHTDGTLEGDAGTVDLFSAETGFMLAELREIADFLPGVVRDRIEKEVVERVIRPFEAGEFRWESCDSNWAAVCCAGVGACYFYLRPHDFPRVRDRLIAAAQSFIDGYPQDGTCMEGFDYWHYGFGYYVWFADMLKDAGGPDLLTGEQVRNIALFPRRVYLGRNGNTTLSFSDGSREGMTDCGLMYRLAREFDGMPVFSPDRTDVRAGNLGLVHWLRTYLYFDPDRKREDPPAHDDHLPDAGQALTVRGSYSFAIKAGHNAEQHNHNDVGGFIFCDRRGQVFCDIGAGKYTRDYFGEGRYSYFCNGSQGHSVPIFDGRTQKAGKEFCGKLTYSPEEFSIDFAAAYGLEELSALTRTVRPFDTGIKLSDRFCYSGSSITERFISLYEPRVEGERVYVGGAFLTLPCGVQISTSIVWQDAHGYDGEKYPVYIIDIILPGTCSRFDCTIEAVEAEI